MLTSKKEINGQANTKKSIFSRTTSVSIHISARQSVTWKILTNIDDFARWNSTILYLKGNLNIGSKLKVKSNLDLEKKSIYYVSNLTPPQKMMWTNGNALLFKSLITYTVDPFQDNDCLFTMTEKLYGTMAPLILGYMPDFDDTFSQFALDLKNEAEVIQKANNLISSLKK
jgi:hypothetical protein